MPFVTLYYQNVAGLRTKTNQTANAIRAADYDLILFTETWLNDSIFSTEIFDSSYYVYRADRNYAALNCTRGGGSLIAVRDTLGSTVLPGSENPAFDDSWAMIRSSGDTILVGCVYFPPHSSVEAYESFVATLDSLISRHRNAKIIIMGDFNLPMINWISDNDILIPCELSTPAAEVLVTGLIYQELQQVNSVQNEFGRYLDLAFVSDFTDLSVAPAQQPISSVVQHHIPVEINFSVSDLPLLNIDEEVSYNFNKADYGKLNDYFSNIDWKVLEDSSDVDSMVQSFYNILMKGIQMYVPKRVSKSHKYPVWYTKETKNIIKLKNKAHRRYKDSKSVHDYVKYANLRKESKQLIDLSYLLYVSNVEQMIPQNVKCFWSYVNNLKKDQSGIPRNMIYNNEAKETTKEIADAFAEHFESCYRDTSNQQQPALTDNQCVASSTFSFFTEQIQGKLSLLDTSKSSGPDGIPPLFLKNCCETLALPLSFLYQRSFDQGYFPLCWKQSCLVPIFKSGSKKDIKNYRGVSLLPIMAKVFESLITEDLFQQFKHYISEDQHGFFKNRSTATNLAVFQDYLVNSVENGKQVDVIYTDLTKAFDRVSHSLLIGKLSALGITGSYLQWISSYLHDRKQCVRIGNTLSREISVKSGVPQGSHLGPVLFLLSFNSVASNFNKCKCLMYADDLKLFGPVSSDDDCNDIQEDLTKLANWCDKNFLEININKCKVLRVYKSKRPVEYNYDISGITLESVDSFNDLGVTFCSDLSFNKHIDNIVIKATRMLGFIRRVSYNICDTKAIKSLYNSLVRSILEYNSIIWSPGYNCHILKLESVQNKFTKFLLYKLRFPYKNLSYTTRIQLAGIDSLEKRRHKAMVFFLYKLINGQICCNQLISKILFRIPNRVTRSRDMFYIRQHRTNYGFHCFSDRLMINYMENFENIDVFNFVNFNAFKRCVICNY